MQPYNYQTQSCVINSLQYALPKIVVKELHKIQKCKNYDPTSVECFIQLILGQRNKLAAAGLVGLAATLGRKTSAAAGRILGNSLVGNRNLQICQILDKSIHIQILNREGMKRLKMLGQKYPRLI